MADFFPKPLLVDGAQLLQKDYGILHHAAAARPKLHMGGKLRLVHPGGDRRADHRGAVAVPGIVLDDEHRPYAALLRPDHRPQIRVVDIASFYDHVPFTLRYIHWSVLFSISNVSSVHTQGFEGRALKGGLRVKIPENTVVHAKKDILTQEDFNSIIALLADEPDIQLPFQIGWFTGMRVNEVLSLTWDDVDIEAGIIHVRKQIVLGKVRVPKTASSIRDIPIGDTLKNILSNAKARQSRMRAEYREHYSTYAVFEGTVIKSEKDSFDYVCRKENGEPISRNSLQWRISWTSKAIGRPYSFHVLRHSHATLLIEAHAPLKAVQGRLGHASPKITMEIYSHVTRKQETEAMEIFERIAHGK